MSFCTLGLKDPKMAVMFATHFTRREGGVPLGASNEARLHPDFTEIVAAGAAPLLEADNMAANCNYNCNYSSAD